MKLKPLSPLAKQKLYILLGVLIGNVVGWFVVFKIGPIADSPVEFRVVALLFLNALHIRYAFGQLVKPGQGASAP